MGPDDVTGNAAHSDAMEDLREPLALLAQRWAASSYRPRPSPEVLARWDLFLKAWVNSDLPLVLRDGRRRGERVEHQSGRQLVFADNSPANWSFALALRNDVPDLSKFTSDNLHELLPLSFIAQGAAAKRNLNKAGWKVCHIAAVSDRMRTAPEKSPLERVTSAFIRFLSPSNIFLVPKEISGAGELPEMIEAIRKYDCQEERPS
jgi:hypothetical protein